MFVVLYMCGFPYVFSHGVNILNVMVKNELNLDTSIFGIIPSHLSSLKVTPLVFVRLTAESKISLVDLLFLVAWTYN